MFRKIFIAHIVFFLLLKSVSAEKINKINVSGNERISKESIVVFGNIDINDDFNENKLNNILKNLYETNFFSDIKLDVKDNVLILTVVENKIIQQIQVKGIKAEKTSKLLLDAMKLKDKSPYNEYSASQDLTLDTVKKFLKDSKSSNFSLIS